MYDPSVNQTAEHYFTTKSQQEVKSSQRQNWMAVSNIMVQNVATRKQEDFNLLFISHGMEDGIYPLKRDS